LLTCSSAALLKREPKRFTRKLDMSRQWVSKYDPSPIQHQVHEKVLHCNTFSSQVFFNVWGFRDDSWRKLIVKAEQPRYDFYHGSTPAFVIQNLIELNDRKRQRST
jgi:hypothetical protein